MELESFLKDFVLWINRQADVVGVALVGSRARGTATEKSDVDLMILTSDVEKYLGAPEWLAQFGRIEETRIETWGRVRTIRTFYEGGVEIEYNFAEAQWASIPIDAGTWRVVSEGMRILYDPEDVLSMLKVVVSTTSR